MNDMINSILSIGTITRKWLIAFLMAASYIYGVSFRGESATLPIEQRNQRDVETHQRVLRATHYGAKGDGFTDDWPAIQGLIEKVAAAGGGTILLGATASKAYRISQALRLRSNVKIEVSPDVVIHCTGDANYDDAKFGLRTGGLAGKTNKYPFWSCLMFGAVEPASIKNLPTVRTLPIARGSKTIKLEIATAVMNWQVGDMISIESQTSWAIFQGDFQPSWRQLNEFVGRDPSTGDIKLKYPVEKDEKAAVVRRLTNTGKNAQSAPGGDAGVPYWATVGASVRGGIWKPTVGGAVTSGGALDCTLKPQAIIAINGSALSWNAATHCIIEVRYIESAGRLLELAWGSAHNHVHITEAVSKSKEGSKVIWLNEGAHDNNYYVENLEVRALGAASVIVVDRAYQNSVLVDRISGSAINGPTVVLTSSAPFSGQYFPPTTNNEIKIGSTWLKSQQQYVSLYGKDVASNSVYVDSFRGEITDINYFGLLIRETGEKNIIRASSAEFGKLYCDSKDNGGSVGHLSDVALSHSMRCPQN